jgi:PrgI family protein
MQFQVPQFIEVEDKIIGPFTFKQFIFIAGSVGLAFIGWRLLPSYVSVALGLGLVSLGYSMAFVEINGQPFLRVMESGFYFFIKEKLYLWNAEKKTPLPKKPSTEGLPITAAGQGTQLNNNKLHELSWSLDIRENIQEATTVPHGQVDLYAPAADSPTPVAQPIPSTADLSAALTPRTALKERYNFKK